MSQMTSKAYLTPPEIAKRYGVDAHKIVAWIRRGELRAIDVSSTPGGRPRYRIAPSDLAVFEASRQAGPTPKAIRRRKDPLIHEYF